MHQRLNLTDPEPVAFARIWFAGDGPVIDRTGPDAAFLADEIWELQAHWPEIESIEGEEVIEALSAKYLEWCDLEPIEDGEVDFHGKPTVQSAIADMVRDTVAYEDACTQAHSDRYWGRC